MNDKGENLEKRVGEMHKRRETMADGKRYIIYYTFGDGGEDSAAVTPKISDEKPEESENV
jgi:hypothetical protein